MRIVVLGSAGQLGRDLVPRLPGEVLAWTRNDVDLDTPTTLPAKLDAVRPDVLINCAAYNYVDRAETETPAAFAVNAFGVQALAKACHERGIKLVHFSTDYVFGRDATRTTPLREVDAPAPVSSYGLSKLAGEAFVQMSGPNHLVLRVCGLYGLWGSGGKGGNFVETMLRVASSGKPLRVVDDQRCTPTYCVDVADATVQLLARQATGLFHLTNADSCTWFEFAQEIFRRADLRPDLTTITSAEYGLPARRPQYSVLDTTKLRGEGITLRPWRDALAAYLAARGTR